MKGKQALKVLEEMNKWRRAEGKYDKAGVGMPFSPQEFGEAIDYAITILKKMV